MQMTVVRSVVDTIFSIFFGSGVAVFLLWLTPYHFVIKQMFLIWLGRVRAAGNVNKYSGLIALCATVSTWIEWSRLRELNVEWTKNKPNPSALIGEKMMRTRTRLAKSIAVCALALFVRRANKLMNGNVEKLVALETKTLDKKILKFRPSKTLLNLVTYPFRSLFHPIFLNMDKIPTERPLMFVSNHTMMAFDFPLLIWELFDKKGIALRALADHSHFQIPINGDILSNVVGAVDGTRHNVDVLMEAKQAIFVYPGGAREVFKKTTDEKYQLFWGDRLGFAELAIQHGCTIVPVTNYGAEDMMNVMADLPMGWLPVPFLWRSDRSFPLVKPGYLQRIYFNIGDPIRTEEYKGQDLTVAARLVRDRTKEAIENDLKFLRAYQQADPHRYTDIAKASGIHSLVLWIKKTMTWGSSSPPSSSSSPISLPIDTNLRSNI